MCIVAFNISSPDVPMERICSHHPLNIGQDVLFFVTKKLS